MPFTDKSKKKKKHKKHKKEKKSKRHKKQSHKRKSISSNSDSSSTSEEEIIKKKVIKESVKHSELGFLDAFLSDSNTIKKEKVEKKASNNLIDKPGQNIRELNPYWKDGGCGLPPTSNEKFDSVFSSKAEDAIFKNKFLKPGEGTYSETAKSSYQGNWKKKNIQGEDSKSLKKEPSDKSLPQTEKVSKTYTNDELNTLAAKLVKAEIMGNTALVEKLKSELEAAKQMKEQETHLKPEENVIVIQKSITKSEDRSSYKQSKKQKLDTHNSKERVCYFPDDDKYSLKNLFEKEKAGREDDLLLLSSKLKGKAGEDLDDAYLEAAASRKTHEKNEERLNQKSIKEAVKQHNALKECRWCLNNRNDTKHLIVSTGSKSYLCIPEEESLSKGHCLIVPLQHEISTMHLDEDVWDEIRTYQKTLTKMFAEMDKEVIFFENARAFKHFPHCYIQCVPLDKTVGELAPIYFQKAILESESEWTANKKLIDFRNKGMRRSIPKGLPYFAVFFGDQDGFAHIIEDEYLFKRNFAEEVLGGMMDLDPRRWRKPQKESFRCQREKALEFLKFWKKFEFNQTTNDSDSSN